MRPSGSVGLHRRPTHASSDDEAEEGEKPFFFFFSDEQLASKAQNMLEHQHDLAPARNERRPRRLSVAELTRQQHLARET